MHSAAHPKVHRTCNLACILWTLYMLHQPLPTATSLPTLPPYVINQLPNKHFHFFFPSVHHMAKLTQFGSHFLDYYSLPQLLLTSPVKRNIDKLHFLCCLCITWKCWQEIWPPQVDDWCATCHFNSHQKLFIAYSHLGKANEMAKFQIFPKDRPGHYDSFNFC